MSANAMNRCVHRVRAGQKANPSQLAWTGKAGAARHTLCHQTSARFINQAQARNQLGAGPFLKRKVRVVSVVAAATEGASTAVVSNKEVSAVLLVGFHTEEQQLIAAQLQDLLGSTAAVIGVSHQQLQQPVNEVVSQASESQHSSNAELQEFVGRVVYFVGAAQQLAAEMNDLLVQMEVAPAVVAAYQPSHANQPLGAIIAQLRQAHAQYYELHQPLKVHPQPVQPVDARVVMAAVMDAGEVPSASGDYRRDEAHLVVLDGMCNEAERQEILDWLTHPGHDHLGSPPLDKWEQGCVDREGDQPTWGLQTQMLQMLQENPPQAIISIQSRLAALYPEYNIMHMPAQALSEDTDSDTPLSSFVGNAVMYGDPCKYHIDADPSSIPPYSPWVHNYGYYFNREAGRPLFVSMLMYLNDQWPEDFHAETMFLDPETQAGIFVRPQPGRIVLMDQDMPHRISAPSREAARPRYSLVWKLVFMPKQHRQHGRPVHSVAPDHSTTHQPADASCMGSHQSLSQQHLDQPVANESAHSSISGNPMQVSSQSCKAVHTSRAGESLQGLATVSPNDIGSCTMQHTSSNSHSQHTAPETLPDTIAHHASHHATSLPSVRHALESIIRPEWGEPVRLGSANGLSGKPAWQPAISSASR